MTSNLLCFSNFKRNHGLHKNCIWWLQNTFHKHLTSFGTVLYILTSIRNEICSATTFFFSYALSDVSTIHYFHAWYSGLKAPPKKIHCLKTWSSSVVKTAHFSVSLYNLTFGHVAKSWFFFFFQSHDNFTKTYPSYFCIRCGTFRKLPLL